MPSPKHRPSALPALELPPQRVAASRRQPSSVAGGPARGVMLSQLPNMLRDPPPARKTDLPRQIALQSSPQSQSRLAPLPPQSLPPQTLPPQTLPPQTLLPLPAKLPSLQPPRTGDLAAAAEPALLRVAVRESRLLRTPENIVRVVSEQDNICDVLLFNPREIAVVGKQRGQAKVEFWYDGQGLNRVSYLVAVDDERAPDMQNRVDLPKIERLVAYLFPNSRVELIGDQGRLIIRGSATSQREAVEILSTVRRSQLIPVTDEIVVQPAAK
jgi:Flp pilus assembly secretin CpaC